MNLSCKILELCKSKRCTLPKGPEIAEEGWGYFILWAEGMGKVGYRKRSHAQKFIDLHPGDICWVHYCKREKGDVVRNEAPTHA